MIRNMFLIFIIFTVDFALMFDIDIKSRYIIGLILIGLAIKVIGGKYDMKNERGRKPTRAEKIRIANARLRVENWLVVGYDDDELVIVNKKTGRIRRV